MTLAQYIALPWTLRGWGIHDGEGHDPYYVVTVDELPGFSVVGDTRAEALGELELALEVYLSAVLSTGTTPKLPATRVLESEPIDGELVHGR